MKAERKPDFSCCRFFSQRTVPRFRDNLLQVFQEIRGIACFGVGIGSAYLVYAKTAILLCFPKQSFSGSEASSGMNRKEQFCR